MARTQSVVPPVDLVVWLGLFLTPRLEQRWIEPQPDQRPNRTRSTPSQMGFNLHTCRLLLSPASCPHICPVSVETVLSSPGLRRLFICPYTPREREMERMYRIAIINQFKSPVEPLTLSNETFELCLALSSGLSASLPSLSLPFSLSLSACLSCCQSWGGFARSVWHLC